MAAGYNDDIEQKMLACEDLPKQKKMAGILKMKFTNREVDAARLIDRLANNLDDTDLATRAAQDMERLRITRDAVLMAYDVLSIQKGMPEDLFQRDYQPKIVEM